MVRGCLFLHSHRLITQPNLRPFLFIFVGDICADDIFIAVFLYLLDGSATGLVEPRSLADVVCEDVS